MFTGGLFTLGWIWDITQIARGKLTDNLGRSIARWLGTYGSALEWCGFRGRVSHARSQCSG